MAVTSVINLGSSEAKLKLASKSALREKTSLKFLVSSFLLSNVIVALKNQQTG
jgi:hypothetical protein